MAFNVKILSVDDDVGQVEVEFEDTSSGVVHQMGVVLTEEFASESDLLDYLAQNWPFEVFTQRGKPKANRYVEVKKLVLIKKNITGRVQNP